MVGREAGIGAQARLTRVLRCGRPASSEIWTCIQPGRPPVRRMPRPLWR